MTNPANKVSNETPKPEIQLQLVLLAAGSSSRLGRAKQGVMVQHQPLIARQLELLISLADYAGRKGVKCNIQCVLGFKAHAIAQFIPAKVRAKVNLVNNVDWQQGMASSIVKAINTVSNVDDSAVLILLVDQWRLSLNHLTMLFDNWHQQSSKITAASFVKGTNYIDLQTDESDSSTFEDNAEQIINSGKFGPPIIFPSAYTKYLAALEGEQGAKKVLLQHQADCQFVVVEEAEIDLDTPEDLAELEAANSIQ